MQKDAVGLFSSLLHTQHMCVRMNVFIHGRPLSMVHLVRVAFLRSQAAPTEASRLFMFEDSVSDVHHFEENTQFSSGRMFQRSACQYVSCSDTITGELGSQRAVGFWLWTCDNESDPPTP